jgi:hypothetical protein
LNHFKIQGKIEDIVKNDDITAACLEENSLIIGTQSGYIHIISLTGMIIKTMKSHDRAVNAIDVDNNGLTIFRLKTFQLFFLIICVVVVLIVEQQ